MSIKLFVRGALVALAMAASIVAMASVKDEVSARISPVGSLCMAGDPCAAAVEVVASGPRSAEEIYNSKCLACHNTGAAGAPKLGDAAAWASRVDSKGIETVYANAINGINGMPAKGLCMDCSDDEIKITVDYILDNSK